MITSAQQCLECGSELPAFPPEGLCPTCLLKAVLAGEPESAGMEDLGEDGQRFGPYTTIRILGEGGMGIVYLARQERPIRREVALKVVKPGMDSRQVITRFESERQALALMDHPNVARIFDAGAAEDGRLYFAMEYVPGTPLLEYCDANRLTNPQRLELFRQIALAVHHAHQKGIIHRDLKPSNVLVTVQDGTPVPKVIDFGVAKAIRQPLTEGATFTGAGVLIGTPEYMSPEQASLGDQEVDASTDIYSLGVLLYELVAGVLPFDMRALRRAGYFEIQRAICEQEPPSPAARLRTLGPAAEEIARRRRTDARSLEREVRGDLEWITLHALEKDRRRRYASASEFAADIERHLNDEPVLAGSPTRTYRLQKFVRRHRLGVSASAAVLGCLLAGITASTVLYVRAERQRDLAERQSYEANLASADALIEAADVENARDRLFRCPARLRNWGWRLLYALSDTSLATLRATGDPVPPGQIRDMRFAFSPDNQRLYFHMHRTVHAWDIPSWKPVADYGIFGPVIGIAQDGSKIVTRALRRGDPELLILDPSAGRRIAALRGHPGALTAAFNARADRVATGSADGTLRLWDAASGRLLASTGPAEPPLPYPRIAFSADGRHIASSAGGLVRLLDARDGKPLHRMRCATGVSAVAFSPDSRHVVTADGTSAIRVWSVASGEAELTWKEVDMVLAAAFSPDGTALVTATQTGVVRVWDASSGSAIATLNGPDVDLEAVAFSPDGHWIMAGSDAGEVWIWDAPTFGGQMLSRSAAGLALSRDGERIAIGNLREAMILEAATGRVLRRGLPAGVTLAFNPAGDRLAIGDRKGGIHLLDPASGSVVLSLAGHRNGVSSVAFSPDGRLLASAAVDNTACIWDAVRGRNLATIPFQTPVYATAFSPDGRLLATGAGPVFDGALRLWDVPSGRLVRRFLLPPGTAEQVNAVVFDARGGRLVSGEFYSGHIRIADTLAGRFTAELASPANGFITSLAFNPDGRLLASGTYDDTIRFWDTLRHELIFALHRPLGNVLGLAFSPDGSKLFASYWNGPLRVWSTSTAYPAEIRELVARLNLQLPVVADVWRHLRSDPTLDEPRRTAALRQCQWRLDSDRALREKLWGPAVYSPDSVSERKLLLRRAEDVYEALPWSVEAWTILGAAQYRNGRYEEAARTLARASAAASDDPRADALLAMSLCRLGQSGKARESLDSARLLWEDADPIPRHDGAALISEAEALLAGRK